MAFFLVGLGVALSGGTSVGGVVICAAPFALAFDACGWLRKLCTPRNERIRGSVVVYPWVYIDHSLGATWYFFGCIQIVPEVRLPVTHVRLPVTQVLLPVTQLRLPVTQVRLPESQVRLPVTLDHCS